MHKYTVQAAHPKGSKKLLIVSDENGRRINVLVHRYALVGKGDEILIDPERTTNIFVNSNEDNENNIKLCPPFEDNDVFSLGHERIDIRIKEITSDEDYINYKNLELYHYKTSNISNNDEDNQSSIDTGGRKAVLLSYIRFGNRRIPAGYIELQMPLLMVKPRHEIFNNPFSHPTRPIKWEKWDKNALKYVNIIVRIARVVTFPELRGLGLAKLLIKEAKCFCANRWHIRGRKPLFIEISAEMLKHIDFVSSSGLYYVGQTEGNIERVSKDLYYMKNDYNISSGIMSLQRKYFKSLTDKAASINISFDNVISKLSLLRNTSKKVLKTEQDYPGQMA